MGHQFESLGELTSDILAKLESPHELNLSPSGQHVVWNAYPDWAKAGTRWSSSVWVADTDKPKSGRRLTTGDGKCLYHAPIFSPTNDDLIAVQSDRGGKEGSLTGIDLIRVGKKATFPLTPIDLEQTISQFAWSPDGTHIAYLSPDETPPDVKARRKRGEDVKVYGKDWQFHRLRIINVATTEATTLVMDDRHVSLVAWSPDSKSIAFVTQKTPELGSPFQNGVEIEVVTLADRKKKWLVHFEGSPRDLCWHGNELWWVSQYDTSLATSAPCVYGMEIRDSPIYMRRAAGETDTVAYEGFSPGLKSTTAGLVVHIQSSLSSLLVKLPEWQVLYDSEDNDVRTWDIGCRDGKTIIAIDRGAAANPPEVHTIVASEIMCLSGHGDAIRQLGAFATARAFRATAEDGTFVDSVLTVPSESRFKMPETGWPTLLIPHGGPSMSSSVGFDPSFESIVPWFAYHGYLVISPNYRGSCGRGHKFISDMMGKPSTKDYSDCIDVLRAAIHEGIVDKERVGIHGWSYGGCIGFVAVTRDSTFHFAAMSALAGGTDWDTGVMTSDTPVFAIGIGGQTPWLSTKDDTHNRSGSPVWHMQNIKTPVMILQGEEDDRVHMTHPRSFHHGCLARGYDCQFVIYPREGHGLNPPFEPAHYVDRLERLKTYFAQHLGTCKLVSHT